MTKRLVIGMMVTAVLAALLLGGCGSEETTTTTEANTATTQAKAATNNPEEAQPADISPAPSVAASPVVQALNEDAVVYLAGAGFEPGQELRLLVATDEEGLRAVSDLTYDSDPEPVANSEGSWVTAWGALGRLADKGVITEGTYSVVIADTDNNPLATVAVAFYDSEKPEEEWPAWAQASGM